MVQHRYDPETDVILTLIPDSHLETFRVRIRDGYHPDTYSDHLLETVQVRSRDGYHPDTYSRLSSSNSSICKVYLLQQSLFL